MKCEICGHGPEHGYSLFRRNPLGEKGIWRCKEHLCAEAFESKAATDFIEEAINGRESVQ